MVFPFPKKNANGVCRNIISMETVVSDNIDCIIIIFHIFYKIFILKMKCRRGSKLLIRYVCENGGGERKNVRLLPTNRCYRLTGASDYL